ncbi:MAG TPA: hypothetical protein VKB05_10985 [Pyrinomonadaceae bacterium]|nr:hypothetical protein [Pyrinomonadaceae bacterium]
MPRVDPPFVAFLAGRYDASSATTARPTQTTMNVGKSVGATD